MPQELIESELIYTGSVITVERDRLLDVNGHEIIREVVRHNGGAGVLPLFDDDRVALVRQYRHPARAELLEIPAGKLEPGESPEECVRREIEEEIGYRAGIIQKLSSFYSTPGFCEEVLHVFLARNLIAVERRPDHDELIEVVFLSFDEALQLLQRGEIVDSKTIIALLLAASLREQVEK